MKGVDCLAICGDSLSRYICIEREVVEVRLIEEKRVEVGVEVEVEAEVEAEVEIAQ